MYLIDKGTDERLDLPYWGSTFLQRKLCGELWEDLAVRELVALGLSAYRPKQVFKTPKHYTLHQRDIHIKIGDTPRRLVVECKSRRSPFGFASVDIGDTKGWDLKQFPVAAVIVIDSVTGEARTAPGDSSCWLVRKNKNICYSVPIGLFSPLNIFADAVKDGLYS